jgi:methionyl-tRNA synthetase
MPVAMTRDSQWGVKVPLENAEGKVLYVWFDAPIGYISATKELTATLERILVQRRYHSLVHFLGKDNIVFHCIIFPADVESARAILCYQTMCQPMNF